MNWQRFLKLFLLIQDEKRDITEWYSKKSIYSGMDDAENVFIMTSGKTKFEIAEKLE